MTGTGLTPPTYGVAGGFATGTSYYLTTGMNAWSLINNDIKPPVANGGGSYSYFYGIREQTDGQVAAFNLGIDTGSIPSDIDTIDTVTINTVLMPNLTGASPEVGMTFRFLDNGTPVLDNFVANTQGTGDVTINGVNGRIKVYSGVSSSLSKDWSDLTSSQLNNLGVSMTYSQSGGNAATHLMVVAFEVVIEYTATVEESEETPTTTTSSPSENRGTVTQVNTPLGRATKLTIAENNNSNETVSFIIDDQNTTDPASPYPVVVRSNQTPAGNVIAVDNRSLSIWLPPARSFRWRYKIGSGSWSTYRNFTSTGFLNSFEKYALLSGRDPNTVTITENETGATVINTINSSQSIENNDSDLI